MHDYKNKSLYIAVIICIAMVNTHIHTQHTHEQTAFNQLEIISAS